MDTEIEALVVVQNPSIKLVLISFFHNHAAAASEAATTKEGNVTNYGASNVSKWNE